MTVGYSFLRDTSMHGLSTSRTILQLVDWDEVTQILFMPSWKLPTQKNVENNRKGDFPAFRNFRWEGGGFIKRSHPTSSALGAQERPFPVDAEFQNPTDDWVRLEQGEEKAVGNDLDKGN